MTDRALAGEAVAWIRFCSDGSYEGPLADSAIDDVRKRSGAWTPLYRSPPSSLLEQAVEALEESTQSLTALHMPDSPVLARVRAAYTALRAHMKGQP